MMRVMTHSHTRKEKTKKPVPKWLKITGGIFAALFVIGGIGSLFEGEPEPAEVPDVVGMPGNEARDIIQGEDFKTEMNALDGSAVFNTGNWEVESTDPTAGELVDQNSQVIVNLIRPEDEAQEQEEPESPADDEPEPADEAQFEITYDSDDYAEDGGTTFVRFEIADNFTQGLIASGAERTTFEALEAAIEEHPETGRVQVIGSFPTMDEYGNEETSDILQPVYLRETIDQINFDNWATIDIWSLRDGGMVNQQLLDNR